MKEKDEESAIPARNNVSIWYEVTVGNVASGKARVPGSDERYFFITGDYCCFLRAELSHDECRKEGAVRTGDFGASPGLITVPQSIQ